MIRLDKIAPILRHPRHSVTTILEKPRTRDQVSSDAAHARRKTTGENQFEFTALDEAIDHAQNISRGNFTEKQNPKQFLNAGELPKQ